MVFRDPGDGHGRLPAVVAAASPRPERGALLRRWAAPVGDDRDGDAGPEAGGAVPQRHRGRLHRARPGGDAGPSPVQPDGQEHARRRGAHASDDTDDRGRRPIDHPRAPCSGAFLARQRTCRARSRPGSWQAVLAAAPSCHGTAAARVKAGAFTPKRLARTRQD
jgi:hypothetical protein